MNMLTQDDLQAIGRLIKEEVPPLIEAGVDDLEARMDIKFEAVHERLEGIEGRLTSVESGMVTKTYLDDKLAHYVPKPF